MWSSTKFAKRGWIAGSFVNSASDLVLSSAQRSWSCSRPRQELIPVSSSVAKREGRLPESCFSCHGTARKRHRKVNGKIVHFNKKCAERAWHSLYLHFLTLWHRRTHFLTHRFHNPDILPFCQSVLNTRLHPQQQRKHQGLLSATKAYWHRIPIINFIITKKESGFKQFA